MSSVQEPLQILISRIKMQNKDWEDHDEFLDQANSIQLLIENRVIPEFVKCSRCPRRSQLDPRLNQYHCGTCGQLADWKKNTIFRVILPRLNIFIALIGVYVIAENSIPTEQLVQEYGLCSRVAVLSILVLIDTILTWRRNERNYAASLRGTEMGYMSGLDSFLDEFPEPATRLENFFVILRAFHVEMLDFQPEEWDSQHSSIQSLEHADGWFSKATERRPHDVDEEFHRFLPRYASRSMNRSKSASGKPIEELTIEERIEKVRQNNDLLERELFSYKEEISKKEYPDAFTGIFCDFTYLLLKKSRTDLDLLIEAIKGKLGRDENIEM